MNLSDMFYDAEIIIEDDNKFYATNLVGTIDDSNGVVIKVVLNKGDRIFKKDLHK